MVAGVWLHSWEASHRVKPKVVTNEVKIECIVAQEPAWIEEKWFSSREKESDKGC